jgi:hypothetical protein
VLVAFDSLNLFKVFSISFSPVLPSTKPPGARVTSLFVYLSLIPGESSAIGLSGTDVGWKTL